MAIVTKNSRTVTGSATRSLGTLGRSIFNSTIGTFADKDTMDQVYKAMEKLNASIETVDKVIDVDALNGRNKPDDLLSLLLSLDIKSSSDFMNKNMEFMKRLMRLNKQERDITLDAIGLDATGNSNIVRNEHLRNYGYVDGNNYYEDYVRTLPQNQLIGDETTSMQLESSTNFNYAGIHNDLYTVTQNLYPDDENKGTFANKWIVENRNSLLYKTKKLFNSRKVNTIISRFHTDPSRMPSLLDNARTKYGLSHGRNLLTKQAEDGYNSSYANGYDNPYCRVWTHHHQYDRLYKTIRPFSHTDDQGNYDDTISVQDFHKWGQFNENGENSSQFGWKSEENNGWQYSVLQDNGLVNITPKYVNGQSSNIHTKQCMFSIENLAWRGYDPYSFEQALSWEQRGPLGGRIMWFPPYGIQFNETTSTNWNNNTFLGRGEDVYTYTNTTRTGTLSFMMVVDHPSIVDYVTWTSENKNVTDTDILRFFAGCGEGDGNGLRDYAKPTPLTDEYVQKRKDETYSQENEGQPKPTESAVQPPSEDKKVIEPSVEKTMSFYVFYPNNYSGTYDDVRGEYFGKDGHNSKVRPIPYLLAGTGAQKANSSYDTFFENDKEITEENADSTWTGNGYEMCGSGISSDDNNVIVGTSNGGVKWSNINKINGSNYSPGTPVKYWYYRIDGRYEYPKTKKEELSHYYNQTLPASSYKDTKSNELNHTIENVYTGFNSENGPITKDGENYRMKGLGNSDVYTLAEVAYVLYEGNSKKQEKCGITESKRIENLKKILSEKDNITSVKATGFASSHGYVETNEELGRHRAQTVLHWFLKNSGINETLGSVGKNETEEKVVNGDASDINAKIWRYARVDVAYNTTETTIVSETGASSSPNVVEKTENAVDNSNNSKFDIGSSPTGDKVNIGGKFYDVFMDDKKRKWYKDDNGTYRSLEYEAEYDSNPIERYGNESGDKNSLRYDQEYHFFKVLKKTDPLVFNSLMDKLQYFDPAFHSMTPEGFNGRLTFLQQCMRQGNTVSASDGKFKKSATNLAFGRAPYCVLRLGDFYNQMIVIDNMSISYDPLVWDLNVEGIGVQPLIANVQLSFKFIGGGDLTGPVRRLQNAMSFNYYANARLYDNRADKVERMWSDKTCGALEHDEILEEDNSRKGQYYGSDSKSSTFYTTQMYK